MKILLGMSGGVDSSVAALLLREAGHQVVGVTFRIWDHRVRSPGLSCCSEEAAEAAARVCGHLGLEHRRVDARTLFRQGVIEPFSEAYLRGRTPNPCVLCNRELKFPELLRLAAREGARAVATGHYARIGERHGRPSLRVSADPRKDQTYFLYAMRPEELERTLFPLGSRRKEEVREIARRAGLPAARRPESQDLCFVGPGGYRAFLGTLAPERLRPGPIVDLEGRRIGTHRGIALYTVGQRRGLGVSAGTRRYVVAIRPEENLLVLGPREAGQVERLFVRGIHWIGPPRAESLSCGVKIRSTMAPAPARIRIRAEGVRVEFERPQWAPAPGQAAVFYRDGEVLGGGTIDREPDTA